jgi:hypothetical protein
VFLSALLRKTESLDKLHKNNLPSLVVILLIGFLFIATLFGGIYTLGLATTAEDQHNYMPMISKPENTPTPTLTPTPTPTPVFADNWLSYINYLRLSGGLPGVTSNATWSDGCWLHSRYMVKNDDMSHSEDPANEWYTSEGNEAAGESNVMVSSSANSTDKYAIDLWMSGPFHGVRILDPQLEMVGFGSYREPIGKWQMGASLDVSRGRTSVEPPAGTYPVMWPGDGQSTGILSYHGTEWPDPLTSCPGITADYWNPSGPPIYLQIGSGGLTPNVSMTSLRQGDNQLEHCVFDENSYTNPDNNTQTIGRGILDTRDAVIIMPKAPFEAGKTYTVSITSNGNTHEWSFTAENSAQTPFERSETYMGAR